MPRRTLLLLLALAACARSPQGPAPRAEFLVSNADSTFWVTADARGIRMRGAPLVLSRVGVRFQELYVADDDRSYYDAIFVGQRMFRRDLISGDSAELLVDGEVIGMAERYAREHPDQRPLAPDEEGAEHPRTSAISELRLLDVHGAFASYEHLTDIDITGSANRHAAHRGVIDLRSSEELTVGNLFGDAEEARIAPLAEADWRGVRDSLLAASGGRGDATRSALDHFEFSLGSFALGARERIPQVEFAVPGSGGRAGGLTLPLPPQPVAVPAWWREVREGLPLGPAALQRWPREHFELVARIDTTTGDRATLALRDGAHEWPVGVVRGPVRRIFWLDAPVLSREGRQALVRAFDAAALYSEETRIVRGPRPSGPASTLREAAQRPRTKMGATVARRRSRTHRAA